MGARRTQAASTIGTATLLARTEISLISWLPPPPPSLPPLQQPFHQGRQPPRRQWASSSSRRTAVAPAASQIQDQSG